MSLLQGSIRSGPESGIKAEGLLRKRMSGKEEKQSQRRWSEKHKDDWGFYQVKDESRKAFRAEKAAYMPDYRQRHPEYVHRDNERRRNRRRNGAKTSGERVRRNQDERFAQSKEIKRLIVELLPCRNQDVICGQMAENKRLQVVYPRRNQDSIDRVGS